MDSDSTGVNSDRVNYTVTNRVTSIFKEGDIFYVISVFLSFKTNAKQIFAMVYWADISVMILNIPVTSKCNVATRLR